MVNDLKWCILKNEFDDSYKNWINACEKYKQAFFVVNLTGYNWFSEINSINFDGFLTCPPGRESVYKQLYDERIYIIDKIMQKFCYPSFNEISLHENKKYLSYWLDANKIPHPKTFVFYNKLEALNFINKTKLPLVSKFNIGASGKGVIIFRDISKLTKYIESAFTVGLRRNWGPNLRMGAWFDRIKNIINNPSHIKNRIEAYKKVYNDIQKGFIILQEYIPHNYEWRIVKIGNSYFGHQKIKIGDKASGTKGIKYAIPPLKYLNIIKDLCDKYHFNSMAVDAFEDNSGGLLINEMQTIFGHVQSYICEKNGNPGRFIFRNNSWEFEEGMFNSNLSYDLRLENAIGLLMGDK